jgi:hypothetical protein
MESVMKSYACPLVSRIGGVMRAKSSTPSSFYRIEVEEYLDMNFGRGMWVRDDVEKSMLYL